MYDNDSSVEARLQAWIVRRCDDMRAANGGVLSGSDLVGIVAELGMTAAEADVRAHVANWDAVPDDEACNVIAVMREEQNVDALRLMTRIESGTVKLPFFEYCWHALPCVSRKPEWEGRRVELSVDLTPRQILFVTTAAFLIAASASILVVMSVTWLSQADARARVQLQAQQSLASAMATAYEQRFVTMSLNSLSDQADTFAQLLAYRFQVAAQAMGGNLAQSTAVVASLLTATAEVVRNSTVEQATAALGTLCDIATAGGTLADVVRGVRLLNNMTNYGVTSPTAPWETIAVQRVASGNATSLNVLVESAMLECPNGPCNYSTLPCVREPLQQRPIGCGVMEWDAAITLENYQSIQLAVYLPTLDAVVCSHMDYDDMLFEQSARMASVTRDFSLLPASSSDAGYNYYLARVSPVDNSVTYLMQSPLLLYSKACIATPAACSTTDAVMQGAQAAGGVYSATGVIFSGENATVVAQPISAQNLVVGMSRTIASLRQAIVDFSVTLANTLNARADFDFEFSVADQLTPFVIDAQLNAFRYPEGCIIPCNRFNQSSEAARLALTTQSLGNYIGPNYQPQPVLAGYSFGGEGFNLGVVTERGVAYTRQFALTPLIEAINTINLALPGSMEIMLVRFQGMPTTKTFDPDQPCDYITACVRDPVLGAVYRSDCTHCAMLPRGVARRQLLEYLTVLKMQSQCSAVRNCTAVNLQSDQAGYIRQVLASMSEAQVTGTMVDYRGVPVLASVSYIANLSVALVVKVDEVDLVGPIQERIGISVAVAVFVIAVTLAGLLLFSRHVLDQIEEDWLRYKEQIDAEKRRFGDLVRDAVPKLVRGELEKVQRAAMTVPTLSFAFLDVVGMSERTKAWAPEVVCRFVGYVFAVVDTVGAKFRVQKVRMFGDTYFGVAGIGDAATTDGSDHCAVRCASFGSVVVQLLAPKYAHYPDAIAGIEEAFRGVVTKHGAAFPDVVGGARDVGHVVMPKMRVGMHFGPGTLALIETGRTPTFDVFGASVGLAARMQSTAQANRLHVTGTMKEILERLTRDTFEFDAPRKTVVKGQGTVTSYFLASVQVDVPEDLLTALGIKHSNLKITYEDLGAAVGPAAPTEPTPGASGRVTPEVSNAFM